MRSARNLRLSARALSLHRARTALAIAGVTFGIAGVVVLTAIGEGARAAVVSRIESLGPNLLVVMPAAAETRAGRERADDASIRELHVDDAAAIVHGARTVVRAAPARDRPMRAKYGAFTAPATILGTTPAWLAIRNFSLARGRFFTENENASRARVAVLGADVRANLFPDSVDPIGRTLRIGTVPFRIVGVLEPRGATVAGASSEDARILIPLETALRRLFNDDDVNMIFLEASAATAVAEAAREAAAILRARRDAPPGTRDGFVIQDQRALIDARLATQISFRRLINALGFISLALGAAGILSVMLLSVRERRREIGLRAAVGAKRLDIAAQFLAESLILAGTGGGLGILLGLAVAPLVSMTTSWNAQVSAPTLAAAIVSAVCVGVVSGVLPAMRAAAIDPIDALQSR